MRTLARRIGFDILAAVIAITINFFIPRLMPGNALSAVLGKLRGTQVTPATIRGDRAGVRAFRQRVGVTEAGLNLIMTGYNTVNGGSMTENYRLLTEVLKNEWGFDGVALSDWPATSSTVRIGRSSRDLRLGVTVSPNGRD